MSKAAFVVIPEFVVEPECLDDFLALAQDDASHSLADEPGCKQFDIVQLESAPNRLVFYEVYDSRAAFEAHLQTPHLARFRAGVGSLVSEALPVRFATRHHP